MARTKKSLSSNTHKGGSFYRRLKPVKRSTNSGRRLQKDDQPYHKLLDDLREELTSKFESDLEETLQQAAEEFRKQDKPQRHNHGEYETDEDDYHRQHKHPSWPWETVAKSPHHQRRTDERERENPENDWRELTRYRPEPEYVPEPKAPRRERRVEPAFVSSSDKYRSDVSPRREVDPSYEVRPVEVEKIPRKEEKNWDSEIEALKDKMAFLEKELLASYQREGSLKNNVEKLEQELSSRQAGLRDQLDSLKNNVAAPAVVAAAKEENKLTSLSMQLTQVMQSMNTMLDEEPPAVDTKTDQPKPIAVDEVAEQAEKSKDTEKSKEEKKTEEKDKVKTDGKGKKKKVLWLFASILLVLGGVGVGMFFFMNGQTEVDPELVRNYLPEAEQPAPEQSMLPNEEIVADADSGSVQGAATSTSPPGNNNFEQAHADVAYGETRWDTHKNPQLGVQFDYPSNSANVVRTDTSVTVLRKTGYIFKIQHIETALDLDDYWNQIKARNLMHRVSETTFRDLPALFLELDDQTDYPGNRYLVKRGENRIYDIWFATTSANLSDDDAKRIDIILNSFKFIE